LRSTAEDLLLWEQRIKDRIKSGISVSEWCEINEITKHKYYYWNHKISKKQNSDKEIEFTEITPIISKEPELKSNLGKLDDFQIFFKDIQVTVPSNFNQDSFAGLMKVLQQL